jgi:chain length determinant protein (polysaccharide antigen chain regulator)
MTVDINNLNPQDEMTLIAFLRILWQQKGLILLIMALSLALGSAYILFSTPLYEATAYLRPPTTADLLPINQGRSTKKHAKLSLYQPSEVYKIFTKVLQSEALKHDFFETLHLPFASASKALSVSEIRTIPAPNNSTAPDYVVAYRGSSSKEDALFVQKYIAMAKQRAVDELLQDLDRDRNNVIYSLKTKIASIREIADTERLDRIEQLKEAIKVAQAIGLKGGTVSPISGVIADASVVNNPRMMYLRGSAALNAEMNNLSRRQSADAFVPKSFKLRQTQALLDSYEKISFNKDELTLFRQDSEIREPDLRIAPRKKLILLLSLFAGLFLGISAAVLRKPLALVLK